MNVNFKKLLPNILQNTRWGQLIEAFQEVLETIKLQKADRLKDQFILDNMTDNDLIRGGRSLGYNISYRDGFTSTPEYLKRQYLTIIPRILNRTLDKGYQHISNIYNLDYNTFPMYYKSEESRLVPITNWKTNLETETEPQKLNTGLKLNTPEFPNLNKTNEIGSFTRNLLYSIQHNNIETADEFMSDNTFRALFGDVKRHKKRTEVMYYETNIELDHPLSDIISSGVNSQLYYSYDLSSSGEVRSYFTSGDLLGIHHIKLGNSKWNIDESNKDLITDVNAFTYRLDITSGDILDPNISSGELASGEVGWNTDVSIQTSDTLRARKWIYPNQRLYTISSGDITKSNIDYFSEMALFDSSSGMVAYAEFPKVNMGYVNNKLYNNIRVKINLI